jgi:hypothetical protein
MNFHIRAELQFMSNEHHSRIKRNVFYDMIQDFTDDDEDESEEEEDEEEDEKHEANSATTTSESIESSTTRFGRFMSPLAFSKISETLGFYILSSFFQILDIFMHIQSTPSFLFQTTNIIEYSFLYIYIYLSVCCSMKSITNSDKNKKFNFYFTSLTVEKKFNYFQFK